MKTQGSISNSNGKDFEALVASKLPTAVREVVTRAGRRYDLQHEDVLIECKYFSGQPGTIWAKIFRDVYLAREDGRVIFVLGGFPKPFQIRELKDFAADVAPNVSVLTFEEFSNEQCSWSSNQPGEMSPGFLPH